MASAGRSRRRSRPSPVRSSKVGPASRARAGSGAAGRSSTTRASPSSSTSRSSTTRTRFDFDQQVGVSSMLFYDPVERVVATLHPNHTWEKVVFDPWRQESWDVNDTVLVADPDRSRCGRLLPAPADADYLPTWHAQRQGGALGPRGASRRREDRHPRRDTRRSPTPTRSGAPSSRSPTTGSSTATAQPIRRGEYYATRSSSTSKATSAKSIDANDRVVMRYDYDMLGTRIHQASMEAGERWMLNDVAGQPIYAWDSRGHRFRTTYDALRRPPDVLLREGAGARAARRAHRLWRKPAQPRGEEPARQGCSALRSGGRCHQRRLRLQGQPAAQPAAVWPGSTRPRSTGRPTPRWNRGLHQQHAVSTRSTGPMSATAPDSSVYRPLQ